ncbi:mRNA export factor GLE1-like isoform X1 [Branchiostoma lanceolatum]|uniref:mRNA export factor GLE1-like isoform X1 n=1 Tax=Branchiostoma lanceolatum TaxID=7740 RepID=UPI0034545AD0
MSTQVSETQVQLERLHSLQEEVNSLETEKTLLQEKIYEESKHRQQLQRDLDDLKSQFQQEKMELQSKVEKQKKETRDAQLALEAANRERELLHIQHKSHDQGDKVGQPAVTSTFRL